MERDILICVLTNLFRIYLIYRLICAFFGKSNVRKEVEIGVYAGYFFMNTMLYLMFHLIWVNIASNLLGIGAIVLLYTKSVKLNLFVTTSIYLINMGCDVIPVMLFVDYKDGSMFNQIYEIVSMFFMFMAELLAEKIVRYKKQQDYIENIPLILVPLCSIILLCFLIYSRNSVDIELVVVSIGLLMINFLVLYLYNMLVGLFAAKHENEMLNGKLQIYANQLEVIMQTEDKVRTLRHDMKHHMNELKLLAIRDGNTEIQAYIDNMEEFIHNPKEIISSGNMEIDSVLNYLLQQAREELKEVKVKVQLPEEICHAFDINVILGNLLENALEAARQTEDKMLNVSIILQKGVLRIDIENSYNGTLKKTHAGYQTTKVSKERHGIGLNSVRKIVEKYEGILNTYEEDKIFSVKVMMYLPETKNW